MRFEGQIRKDGRYWVVEIPAFDAVTQGRTKREAFAMAEDLIETMADEKGFTVTAYPLGQKLFEIEANRVGALIALLLRRQRERHGLTLSEAAERLGQRSRNAYARYEQGKAMPSVEKLDQLLAAIAPDQRIVWRIAA
jgi:DNA-binding XRE family transcriptional regulator